MEKYYIVVDTEYENYFCGNKSETEDWIIGNKSDDTSDFVAYELAHKTQIEFETKIVIKEKKA